jgi:DNA-binding transcriptional regulator YhcF (GntR family)
MKLWLSRNTEVPLQEQLSAQLVLGIVSSDLAPGERLPSSSQLARRFRIHPNTVRLAYRDLVRNGWIEWRRGSGFFVRDRARDERRAVSADLDRLVASFLETARRRGHSSREIRSRLSRWLSVKAPGRVLLVEPDTALRKILLAEIQDFVTVPVSGIGPEALSRRKRLSGVIGVTLFDRARDVRIQAPPEMRWVLLKSRSIPEALAGETKPAGDVLITVASEWPGFLQRARATLTAVGIDPAAVELLQGDAERLGNRLAAGNFVITDSLVGRSLQSHPCLRVFRIIAEESIGELQSWLRNDAVRPSNS